MTLPTSGLITAAMINKELGRAENAAFSLDDTTVRALAERPTGVISFFDFYGKSSEIILDAPLGNGTNLSSLIFNNYEPGLWESSKKKRLRITGERNSLRIDKQYGGEFILEVMPGGILSGGTWMEGLAIDTGVTSIVPVINNGIIRGRGGNGGQGGRGGNGSYQQYQREPAQGFEENIWTDANIPANARGYRWSRKNNLGEYFWDGVVRATLHRWTDPPPIISGNDGWTYLVGRWIWYNDVGWDRWDTWALARERMATITTNGGNGGNGGIGIGYGIAPTAGLVGGSGGQNAGAGGKGGNGGGWGQDGGAGATGAAGSVSAGSAGVAGSKSFAIWGAQRAKLTGSGEILGALVNN